MRSPAVHTIDLRKDFRGKRALGGLSMTVERGEIFGFLGPNGAGKTTAVKLLLGLIRPSGGEAMVLGAPAGDRETKRRIGYLPELFRFPDWLTAAEVLTVHARLLRLAPARRPDAVGRVLETVGLADRRADRVGTFSKGMQQRLGLAVALLGGPELVILDEPTSALDPVGRHDVREIIRTLRSEGSSVFLNTHLLEEAEQVCDRVTVVERGRAIASGTIGEIVGGTARVRVRVSGLTPGWWREARGARWREEGEWLVAEDVGPNEVPAIVADLVARGGAVEAVVPEQVSLEDRFIELLSERR